jgi:fucose permease
MWGANAAAPLNTAHLGYGIGAVFVNLLVRPFLTEKVLTASIIADQGDNSTLLSNNTIKTNSNIVVPYIITATLCVLIAAGHIYFYIRALRTERQKSEVREVRKN